MVDTEVFLMQNSRDKSVYDVCQKRKDGTWVVWGFVHVDFLHDSGLMEQIEETKYPYKIVCELKAIRSIGET